MREAKSFSRREIAKIATEYATSGGEYSRYYFCRHYGIAGATFYALLKKAIVESIVDMETAEKIGNKTMKNSEKKGGRERSRKAYMNNILLREKFIFIRGVRISYANKYAGAKENMSDFCKKHYIADEHLLERVLDNVIINGLVSDEVAERLKEKSVRLYGENAVKLYEELYKKRNEIKEKKKYDAKQKRVQKAQEAKKVQFEEAVQLEMDLFLNPTIT